MNTLIFTNDFFNYLELYNTIEFFIPSTYPNIKPDRYLISDHGNIYDTKLSKMKQVNARNGGKGYVPCSIRLDNGKIKQIYIHRLVAWEFCEGYSEEDGKIFIDHINFDKSCNHHNNLEWVTSSENNKRRFLNVNTFETMKLPPTRYGMEHPFNVYSEEQIIEICELLEQGKKYIETCKHFGYIDPIGSDIVFYNHVGSIYRRRTWKHISCNYKW